MSKFLVVLAATLGLLFLMKSFPLPLFAKVLFMVPAVNVAFTVGFAIVVLFGAVLMAKVSVK